MFYLLEAHGLEPWLVNARDVKHLPGRPKTDVLDAVWLCKVAERQMLRPSFVPPRPIRAAAGPDPLPHRSGGARTAEKNRVEKLLEDACIKLSVVASDIFGVSGRAMMAALIAGERDPKVLAQMARARMRTKIARLEEAFNGHFDDHHAFLLARMLDRIDGIDADIAALDDQIEAHLAPFAAAAARLDEIPASARSPPRSSSPRSGWTCPGFPPPGTCVRGRSSPPASTPPPAKPRATVQRPRQPLPGPASSARPPWWPAGPTPSSAPGTGASPDGEARNAPSSRSGARSWSSSGTCSPATTRRFTDLGADHFTRHLNPDAKKRNHIRQLEALGYTVTLTPAA